MASPEANPDLGALVSARVRTLGRETLDALGTIAARVHEQTPDHAAALDAIAAAHDLPLAELLALDGGLVSTSTGAELERSLGLYVDSPRGPILAGAWALEPALAAAVSLHPLALPQHDTPGEHRQNAWAFGVPAGLPLAGIAASGFAVVSNHLRPAAPGPGLPGAVLLRQLLAAPRSEHARAMLDGPRHPLAGGRNWMLADGANFHGYEQLGDARTLTRVGRKVGHVHANHCFDPSLRQREARPRSPLSFRRLELASTLYVQRRPASAEAVLEFFAEVEREAFTASEHRAQCWLAIELAQGRALWQHASAPGPTTVRFATPFA